MWKAAHDVAQPRNDQQPEYEPAECDAASPDGVYAHRGEYWVGQEKIVSDWVGWVVGFLFVLANMMKRRTVTIASM